MMKQLLSAVNECHKSAVVHRDIKLDNILIGKDYYLKLSDFGHAAINLDDVNALFTEDVGTGVYCSPQII